MQCALISRGNSDPLRRPHSAKVTIFPGQELTYDYKCELYTILMWLSAHMLTSQTFFHSQFRRMPTTTTLSLACAAHPLVGSSYNRHSRETKANSICIISCHGPIILVVQHCTYPLLQKCRHDRMICLTCSSAVCEARTRLRDGASLVRCLARVV